MKKEHIKHIIIHKTPADSAVLANKVSSFHAELIARRLNAMPKLSRQEKIEVIDAIIRNLKSRDERDFIK